MKKEAFDEKEFGKEGVEFKDEEFDEKGSRKGGFEFKEEDFDNALSLLEQLRVLVGNNKPQAGTFTNLDPEWIDYNSRNQFLLEPIANLCVIHLCHV